MPADRDPTYLAWVKRQPCCAPGARAGCSGPVEAHHAGRRGVGQKAKDSTAIPLCAAHHRWGGWHEHKGPFRGWTADRRREWADERIAETQAKWLRQTGGGLKGDDVGQTTKIQWTDRTWNPIRGCSRVSEGCRRCYAERHAGRFAGPGLPFEGFARIHRRTEERDVVGRDGSIRQQVRTTSEAHWTGKVELVPGHLGEPLRWRKPSRVFVNSMSDLFHEALANEEIAAVFGVMAACPQHTFQVLTKRPERAREWFRWARSVVRKDVDPPCVPSLTVDAWPLSNVWLGVSVEDQATADQRIPLLLDIPAALRFVSAEPLLSPVDLSRWLAYSDSWDRFVGPCPHGRDPWTRCEVCEAADWSPPAVQGVKWVIVGGESGPGARPFDLEWARKMVRQCREAGVACFVKQIGSNPVQNFAATELLPPATFRARRGKDRKGGDPAAWPEDLRVREFPTERLNHGPLVDGAGQESTGTTRP